MKTSRALVVVARLVVALVALVLLAYLGINGAGMLAASGQREELSREITRQLADTVPAARERQQQLASAATREPDRSWLVQECDFATDESGWIVQNYREVCALRAVSAWQVADEAEARALLADVPGLRAVPERSLLMGCTDVASGPAGRAAFAPVDTAGDPWCLRRLEPDDYDPVRPIDGAPAAFDRDVSWVVVDHEEPLVDEDLGCVHWSVIFCDNPFGDELAWGDAPEPA